MYYEIYKQVQNKALIIVFFIILSLLYLLYVNHDITAEVSAVAFFLIHDIEII